MLFFIKYFKGRGKCILSSNFYNNCWVFELHGREYLDVWLHLVKTSLLQCFPMWNYSCCFESLTAWWNSRMGSVLGKLSLWLLRFLPCYLNTQIHVICWYKAAAVWTKEFFNMHRWYPCYTKSRIVHSVCFIAKVCFKEDMGNKWTL